MSILFKGYFSRLRLLTSSDVKENPKPRASRRTCRVLYANIRVLHKNLSPMARGGEMAFCSETLVSSGRHISEITDAVAQG